MLLLFITESSKATGQHAYNDSNNYTLSKCILGGGARYRPGVLSVVAKVSTLQVYLYTSIRCLSTSFLLRIRYMLQHVLLVFVRVHKSTDQY